VIVYEDRWIVVADKPHGVPTQGTAKGRRGLVEELSETLGRQLVLHHRLDQPASGLVVFGAHPHANKGLAAGFRNHTIQRRYRAILSGEVVPGSWSWKVDRKSARSDVEVEVSGAGVSAVWVTLHTGRRHQIRVHASMAGHPILGDRRYGVEVGRAWPRLALHAAELSFEHPVTGESLALSAPLPDDLRPLWERLA